MRPLHFVRRTDVLDLQRFFSSEGTGAVVAVFAVCGERAVRRERRNPPVFRPRQGLPAVRCRRGCARLRRRRIVLLGGGEALAALSQTICDA